MHKLSGYGIHGNLLLWIGAFLTGRLQQVKVGTKLSSRCPVTSGVPQGSVVGSLLFNLFNYITDHLDPSVTSKMFADDIKIHTELKNQNSTVNVLTQLDSICQWSIRWQLPISYAKCNLLYLGRQEPNGALLTINGIALATSSFTKDLGVVIDPDLKFGLHIIDLVARAKQRAAIIHRCFISRNTGNLIRAFETYVRPM